VRGRTRDATRDALLGAEPRLWLAGTAAGRVGAEPPNRAMPKGCDEIFERPSCIFEDEGPRTLASVISVGQRVHRRRVIVRRRQRPTLSRPRAVEAEGASMGEMLFDNIWSRCRPGPSGGATWLRISNHVCCGPAVGHGKISALVGVALAGGGHPGHVCYPAMLDNMSYPAFLCTDLRSRFSYCPRTKSGVRGRRCGHSLPKILLCPACI
jgi:hypothetical protein